MKLTLYIRTLQFAFKINLRCTPYQELISCNASTALPGFAHIKCVMFDLLFASGVYLLPKMEKIMIIKIIKNKKYCQIKYKIIFLLHTVHIDYTEKSGAGSFSPVLTPVSFSTNLSVADPLMAIICVRTFIDIPMWPRYTSHISITVSRPYKIIDKQRVGSFIAQSGNRH